MITSQVPHLAILIVDDVRKRRQRSEDRSEFAMDCPQPPFRPRPLDRCAFFPRKEIQSHELHHIEACYY